MHQRRKLRQDHDKDAELSRRFRTGCEIMGRAMELGRNFTRASSSRVNEIEMRSVEMRSRCAGQCLPLAVYKAFGRCGNWMSKLLLANRRLMDCSQPS
jgi:hypothetical protein